MIDVLLIAGSIPEARQSVALAGLLEPLGVRVHLATIRGRTNADLRQIGFERVYSMEPRDVAPAARIDHQALIRRYTEPTVAEMISSEQILGRWSRERKLAMLSRFLEMHESYFDEHDIRLVMKYPTCSMAGRSAYAVARARGLPTLIANTGPIVSDSFTLNDINESSTWSEFEQRYDDRTIPVTDEMRQAAKDVVEAVAQDKARSKTMFTHHPLRVSYNVARLAVDLVRGRWDYAQRYEVRTETRKVFGDLLTPFMRYDRQNSDRPFIFFPLHIPWDAQIATRNPMFESQEAIVDMLARACPPGHDLVIKEHPYFAGGVNRRFLSACRRIPGIRIVRPETSSFDLLSGARAVVTINSTAGWEALLHRKPLIVLGNPFYAKFRGAYAVENVNDIPSVLNRALVAGESVYADDDEWVRFIDAATTTPFRESIWGYKNYMGFGRDGSDERLRTIALQVAGKMKSLCERG